MCSWFSQYTRRVPMEHRNENISKYKNKMLTPLRMTKLTPSMISSPWYYGLYSVEFAYACWPPLLVSVNWTVASRNSIHENKYYQNVAKIQYEQHTIKLQQSWFHSQQIAKIIWNETTTARAQSIFCNLLINHSIKIMPRLFTNKTLWCFVVLVFVPA